MAVFKCKMCGGDLNITETDKVVECEYCGTTQTVPSADNEKKMTLFNRANKLRFNCEFDKAAGIYESIIAEFPEEAEAYWGIVLCQYGIEYVDDPATGKKIPTCHRSSFESVLEDDNFAQACENADLVARRVYREEAKRIEEIRKGIIEVSSKEEPYDIFICYKETDENGDRTVDSAIAQDVYTALTEKGYRVFFSRISLEDKLGQEYEPYIFAALNSARIMLVFGTDFEYFDAVWVKNEWSRFLQLIAAGQKKTLIPCYKDIDAYDMPKEFAKLQSQDMGKVGAIQDLLRGIEKILPKVKPAQTATPVQQVVVANHAAASTESLLKRAFMFLEDGNWKNADEYAEKVLDIDPENAEAYLAKAMSELTVESRATLAFVPDFAKNTNTSKALRYGNDALKAELNEYIETFRNAEEKRRQKEEKRRLEEEVRRKAEKEKREADAQKKAKKVIAAIRRKQQEATIGSLEQQLAAKRQEISFLMMICNNFDGIVAQLKQKNNVQNDLRNKINELQAQRNALGVFSGKEKKRLEGEIFDKSQQMQMLSSEIAMLTNDLHGFQNLQQAEQALNGVKKKAESIEKEIADAREEGQSEFTFPEAVRCCYGNPYVRQMVVKEAPDLMYNGFVTIQFGRYPQEPGKESAPIEWLVLTTENDRALLLSKYALDCKPYNNTLIDRTWENCTLRTWLNGTFYDAAFDMDYQKRILNSTVTADKNPSKNRTQSGNNTTDKVFLLSIPEADKYFISDEARRCAPTAYAVVRGAYSSNDRTTSDGKATCFWWLRSPGKSSDYATMAIVLSDGDVYRYGNMINRADGAVRPAMWIDLS